MGNSPSGRKESGLNCATPLCSFLSLLMPRWDLKLGPHTVKPERFSTLPPPFPPLGSVSPSQVRQQPSNLHAWEAAQPHDSKGFVSPPNPLNDSTRSPSFHGLGNQTCSLVIAPAESCGFSPSLAPELRIEAPLAPSPAPVASVLGAGPRETGRCAHVPPRAPGDALVTRHPRQAGQAGHSHSPPQSPCGFRALGAR